MRCLSACIIGTVIAMCLVDAVADMWVQVQMNFLFVLQHLASLIRTCLLDKLHDMT